MPIKQPVTENSSSASPWIPPRNQAAVFILVGSALTLIMSYWLYLGGHRGQLIEIDRATPRKAQFLVDLNTSGRSEIIQLPGLGEVLTLRVLADRRDNGLFQSVDDLLRVDGIGVKTLENLRPYLYPIAEAPHDQEVAADKLSPAE